MSRLLAEEGDRHFGARGDPPNLAARSVDATWDIYRGDRQPPRIDSLYNSARHAFYGSRETCPKNTVDDECRTVERRQPQFFDSSGPARRRLLGVAAQRRGGGKQRQAHRPATL